MRILLAEFDDRIEAYTSMKPFLDKYPQYKRLKEKINYRMSRKKQPFESSEFRLYRLKVYGKK
jgi:hypothetical protein